MNNSEYYYVGYVITSLFIKLYWGFDWTICTENNTLYIQGLEEWQ